MFDNEFLGVLIFFSVAMFDRYKAKKSFFFIIILVSLIWGSINYWIPFLLPAGYMAALKGSLAIGLAVSGAWSLAKKRISDNQTEENQSPEQK